MASSSTIPERHAGTCLPAARGADRHRARVDYLNGLHDAANSIATVVATRLLSPLQAVASAAVFNFAAYFLTLAFPWLHAVANTIGKGLIAQNLVTPVVVFGALVRAMFWNG